MLVDDHQLVIEGFKSLLNLQPAWKVVSCHNSVKLALESLDSEVDIAIVDISMPDGDGLELISKLIKASPEVKIVVVTMFNRAHYIDKAFSLGARGFVSKRSAAEELIQAIEKVELGGTYVSQDALAVLLESKKNPIQIQLSSLTKREYENFRLLATGLRPKEIAYRLKVTEKTAFTHRANIYKKLGINSQFEITKLALKEGITTHDELID